MYGYTNVTSSRWDELEKARHKQKVLEMNMGKFNESLFGSFDGYYQLQSGHYSSCDVASNDDNHFLESRIVTIP